MNPKFLNFLYTEANYILRINNLLYSKINDIIIKQIDNRINTHFLYSTNIILNNIKASCYIHMCLLNINFNFIDLLFITEENYVYPDENFTHNWTLDRSSHKWKCTICTAESKKFSYMHYTLENITCENYRNKLIYDIIL